MPTQFKAVIFDLDGTLLDTLADIGGSANEVLTQRGYPTHELSAYRYFIGDGVATLFHRILPEDSPASELISDCVADFETTYGKKWKENTQLYSGIADLLDELVQSAVPIAILSNKPHDFVKLCVSEFLANWPFDPIFGQREDIPRKPDPAGVREVCELLEVRPEECVYVGDSSVDMQTARNSGTLPVGVSWGFRPVEELVRFGADQILDTPAELLDLFRTV